MGVKGLQSFVEGCVPGACEPVRLADLAESFKIKHPGETPCLVVDAPCCIRFWYTPQRWVQGGQWKEYLESLNNFLRRLADIGLHLVFFFDGSTQQPKRQEWARRRHQNSREISCIFRHIQETGQQPLDNMSVIPSSLCSFTRSALQALGAEVIRTTREADYEVAEFARSKNCIGILGQDTDYLVYDTVPYLSINSLDLETLTTVMYVRGRLCEHLRIRISDMPVLACLMGNDVVDQKRGAGFRRRCAAPGEPPVAAVARYLRKVPASPASLEQLERELFGGEACGQLQAVVADYTLAGLSSPWLPANIQASLGHGTASSMDGGCKASLCTDVEFLQLAQQQGHQLYKLLVLGELDVSNSLEDPAGTGLPPAGLLYRPVRQHIYGLLLGIKPVDGEVRQVKEWIVYPGNDLREPELIAPLPLDMPGGALEARSLWQPAQQDAARVAEWRLQTFLACFGLSGHQSAMVALESGHTALCCLLGYMVTQIDTFYLEDVKALLAQALCLKEMDAQSLARLPEVVVDARAVHLGALAVRGLHTMLTVNSASGKPLPKSCIMPWELFDGHLFQHKYQQAHQGAPSLDLLDGQGDLHSVFEDLLKVITSISSLKSADGRLKTREHVSHDRPRGLNTRPRAQAHRGSRERGGLMGSGRQDLRSGVRGGGHGPVEVEATLDSGFNIMAEYF
ncbi:constitutive coactivator of peroxisome proliferator-activated receptor gamma [Lethenteron reissneri]|uniref:constitutive coactivator of peroxisome proliferator-activated receptor gamma n=1 Tax=Lethenteron reissneri TaxID=7753 RepID=UPI002AB7B4AF|nr:constitutive coactivator of peroxisome proliferator-activated receptor gamma [Lethenteron reissneri]